MTHVDWQPYPQEKPKSFTMDYLVTVVRHYGKHQVKSVKKDTWADSKTGGEWETFDNSPDTEVTAWAELPEPYSKEMKNKKRRASERKDKPISNNLAKTNNPR